MNKSRKSLMREYSDDELSATVYMFNEYLSFSTGCHLSKITIFQLNEAKIHIDTVLNNQFLFND